MDGDKWVEKMMKGYKRDKIRGSDAKIPTPKGYDRWLTEHTYYWSESHEQTY